MELMIAEFHDPAILAEFKEKFGKNEDLSIEEESF
jgi:hypothetical protein